ncbi:ADP-ribosylation factor family-domain-containing protein [Mycena latifolia]|nr:ADP-ribosylation factor family-domain-containing protein [Mycena latifolia]
MLLPKVQLPVSIMPPTLSLRVRLLIDRFSSRASGTRHGYTIPLLGLDACGKTTLLQRMNMDQLVRTIGVPTMGIFLEAATIGLPGMVNELIKIRSWDVGGCGKRLPPAFLAHYTQTAGSDALIWLVDSSDRERLTESVEELSHVVQLVSYPTMNAKDIPVLILATKQDLPHAMTPGEVQSAFASVTSGLNVFVLGTTLTQSLTEGALPEAFRWLMESVDNARTGKPPPPSPPDDLSSPTALEIELDSWLERAEKDSSATRFLRQFENASLHGWDHYTRIRAIYTMLTLSGRQKGRDMILQGIEKYTAISEQPFNVTMTYFWIQVVHFCICGMPPATAQIVSSSYESVSYLESMLDTETLFDSESITSAPASDWSLLEDDTEGSLGIDSEDDGNSIDSESEEADAVDHSDDSGEPSDAGFVRFLLLNPFIADEDLWIEYYSRDLMMGSKARAKMVLPDRRRLPNLVGREVISSSLKKRT